MKNLVFILLIVSFAQTSYGWTLQDLLEKKKEDLRLKPFEGGNFLEMGFSQIQLTVQKDNGRPPIDNKGKLQDDREGNRYFLKFSPRGFGEMMAQQRIASTSKLLAEQQNKSIRIISRIHCKAISISFKVNYFSSQIILKFYASIIYKIKPRSFNFIAP